MTRYSTDHSDPLKNALAVVMNRVADFAHEMGDRGERISVTALLEYVSEWREIEEAEPIQQPVCSPEMEDRI